MLPHKISTLLYVFDPVDRVLLLERTQPPNHGLWSPPGGKLHTHTGESPYACACREAHEEMGLQLTPADLHLTGLISEAGYAGTAHWLMFLFEVRSRTTRIPPDFHEGRFAFFDRAELSGLSLPRSDREALWPLFWANRGGFFSASCACHPDGKDIWTLEAGQSVGP